MRNKIKSKLGETIAETLVALLISSLALVMLAGAITASSGIVNKSSKKIDEYYTANEKLINMQEIKDGNISIKTNGIEISSLSVVYGKNDVLNKNTPIIIFKEKEDAP